MFSFASINRFTPAALAIFSGFFISSVLIPQPLGRSEIVTQSEVTLLAAVHDLVSPHPETEEIEPESIPLISFEAYDPYTPREKRDIGKYTAVNPDVRGYIKIPGAGMEEVVLQSSNGDRDFYLYKDWRGDYSKHGSVYFDNGFSLTDPAHKIWVLYGHNNANGSGFPAIHKWNPTRVGVEQALSFYKKHHIVELDTVYEGADWQIFALFVHAANMQEDGEHFTFFWNFNFDHDEDYQRYIDNIRIRSLIVTPVRVTVDDTIALLSTCITDGYNYYGNQYKNWRLVMALRKASGGVDPKFDASPVYVNPNPLMPDIWHKNTGKQKPAKAPAPAG